MGNPPDYGTATGGGEEGLKKCPAKIIVWNAHEQKKKYSKNHKIRHIPTFTYQEGGIFRKCWQRATAWTLELPGPPHSYNFELFTVCSKLKLATGSRPRCVCSHCIPTEGGTLDLCRTCCLPAPSAVTVDDRSLPTRHFVSLASLDPCLLFPGAWLVLFFGSRTGEWPACLWPSVSDTSVTLAASPLSSAHGCTAASLVPSPIPSLAATTGREPTGLRL